MRQSLPSAKMTQPYVMVFVTAYGSVAPSFAMTNYGIGILDSDTVKFAGKTIPVLANIENVSVTEMKPSTLGYGLHKREASFDIRNGEPFNLAPFSNQIYGAGANLDDFYFSLWVTDFSKSLEEISSSGVFFGHYKLDSGLTWEESTGTTSIKLVEMLSVLNGRYNQNTEDAEQILAGSEWQSLLDAPAYLGWKPKVKVVGRSVSGIGGFDSYYKSVKSVISGLVQSSTLSGTSIVLGKSPVLAGLVGSSAKLKMGNGCIITGTITDLGSGDYGIDTTGLVINDKWDTILVYNKGFTVTGDDVGQGGADMVNLQSVFLDSAVPLTRVPSPTMYLRSQSTIEFYNGGPVTSSGPMFVKLTGITDEANKELSTEEFKDPGNTASKFTGVNIDFFSSAQSSNFSDAALLHLNYAKWLAPQDYDLFFSNKTFVLADIQLNGMPWDLIITPHVNASAVVDPIYYIRLIPNNILAESSTGQHALFADNGKTLIPIASADITSIEYNNTDFGMVDLCKITMARRLRDIDEAYDENFLYADTGPAIYAGEVISYILDKAGVPNDIRSTTLRTGTATLGNPLSLAITDETWSELLDSVVFESGLQIDTVWGMYHARASFNKSFALTWNRPSSSQRFLRVRTDAPIAFGDMVDGTYHIEIGKTATSIDASRREFVRVHYTYKYLYSEYKGLKYRTLESTKVAKDNDRIIDYTFKHVTDSGTATAAATQMTRMGHIANIGEVPRTIIVGLPMEYMQLQVMDTIELRDFRHVTALNSPLPAYDSTNAANPVYTVGDYGVYARYDDATQYMLLPGVGVVSQIVYNFSGSGVPITVTFKQVQFGTESNLRDVADRLDLNTVDDNTGATEPQPSTNYPSAAWQCVDDSHVTNVVVTPGDYTPGKTTTAGCCNESTTDADTTGEQKVTIVCVGDVSPPDPWVHGCLTDPNVWFEVQGPNDIQIGNSDPVIFKLFSLSPYTPILTNLNYPGKPVIGADTCVYFDYRDNSSGFNAWFATLTIYPCVFSAPAGLYSKGIEMKFDVLQCYNEVNPSDPLAWQIAHSAIFRTTKQRVTPLVMLRPVSDITIG